MARTTPHIIRAHLRPAYGGLRLREMTGERLAGYAAARPNLADETIRNHLTLLISMLNVAVGTLHWLPSRPKIQKPPSVLFGEDYRWLRTEAEIGRFLAAAREEGELVFVLYATALYTGMREGELAGLLWIRVDLDRRLITIEKSYRGRTKSKRVRYVPILEPLFPILRRWRLRSPGELVFPNQAGNMHDGSARIFHETLHRVLDRAGFPLVERRGKLRSFITFHDLRHSFGSRWVQSGGDIFRLQKILGHTDIKLTMRYAHLAPEAFAEDYGRLGSKAPGEAAAVIELAGTRKD